jgi:hypothetical protein
VIAFGPILFDHLKKYCLQKIKMSFIYTYCVNFGAFWSLFQTFLVAPKLTKMSCRRLAFPLSDPCHACHACHVMQSESRSVPKLIPKSKPFRCHFLGREKVRKFGSPIFCKFNTAGKIELIAMTMTFCEFYLSIVLFTHTVHRVAALITILIQGATLNVVVQNVARQIVPIAPRRGKVPTTGVK